MRQTGSGPITLFSQFICESSYDKVASATNPRAQFASYTYTAQGLPLTVTALAETAGMQPVATFT
jgi:YD repeat-containing protein